MAEITISKDTEERERLGCGAVTGAAAVGLGLPRVTSTSPGVRGASSKVLSAFYEMP